MKLRTIALAVLIMAVVGLMTPQGRLLVMSYYEKLKSLIAGSEGLSLEAYQDTGGKWTIGYGHLINPGEIYYPYGSVRLITLEEADALFAADTSIAQNCVDQNVTVPLTDNQRAALVSFVFNVGCYAFTASTMLVKLNNGDFPSAADEFDKWINVTVNGIKIVDNGLINRRAKEKQVFLA